MAYPIPPLANDLLLRAINLEPLPRVPVWLMRQAGRSDPEYMAYRERTGLPLYDLFRSPEHAIPISLLPLRIGVDAIIMFQDILTPLTPMGADFRFSPGPVLDDPVRSPERVAELKSYDMAAALPFVRETLRGLLRELSGRLPVLGFAGAPFTLAAFMIEGKSPGPGLPAALAFARAQPRAFEALMERLTETTIAYLNFQVAAGAHAVQLFESVGDGIPRDLYERHAQPSHERIFAALAPEAPGILFVKGSPYPELMVRSGAAAVSVAETTPLSAVLDAGLAVQGNVDNRLLAEADGAEVEAAVAACIAASIAASGGRGHILNLGHGVLPHTPFENVRRFVAAAHAIALPD